VHPTRIAEPWEAIGSLANPSVEAIVRWLWVAFEQEALTRGLGQSGLQRRQRRHTAIVVSGRAEAGQDGM
jgi:hypothetical protein